MSRLGKMGRSAFVAFCGFPAPFSQISEALASSTITDEVKTGSIGAEVLGLGNDIAAEVVRDISPRLNLAFQGAGQIVGIVGSYAEGREHGQDKVVATGRGMVTWGLGATATELAVLSCPVTFGLGCAAAPFVGAGTGYLAGKAYDAVTDWANGENSWNPVFRDGKRGGEIVMPQLNLFARDGEIASSMPDQRRTIDAPERAARTTLEPYIPSKSAAYEPYHRDPSRDEKLGPVRDDRTNQVLSGLANAVIAGAITGALNGIANRSNSGNVRTPCNSSGGNNGFSQPGCRAWFNKQVANTPNPSTLLRKVVPSN